jgi:hypothetical protein
MSLFDRGSHYRTWYRDISRTLNIEAGDVPSTVGANFLVGKAGFTIFVQRISVHVLTAAAQAITFQDDAGSPIEIAILPASAAVGDLHVLLSSEEGVALTPGTNLDIVGAAGVQCRVIVEAYLKQTSALSVAALAAS